MIMNENRECGCNNEEMFSTNQEQEKIENDRNMECNQRREMAMQIRNYEFAITELALYLDTHPWDGEALAYFREYSYMRNDALKEYAKYYGPLTLDTMCTPADKWRWIDTPWPWQEGGC